MTENELALLIRERPSSAKLLPFLNSEQSQFRYLSPNRFSVALILRDAAKLAETREVAARVARDLQAEQDVEIDWKVGAIPQG